MLGIIVSACRFKVDGLVDVLVWVDVGVELIVDDDVLLLVDVGVHVEVLVYVDAEVDVWDNC